MWRGNIDVSPVPSKDAAVNYISKYAAKAESMSSELDNVMLEYAREELDDGWNSVHCHEDIEQTCN